MARVAVSTAVPLILLGLGLFTRPKPAHADIDLNGTWNIVFQMTIGPQTKTHCPDIELIHEGADFAFAEPCIAPLEGTLDKETGEFIAGAIGESGSITVTGTVSADGNTMNGFYTSTCCLEGTFTAERKVAPATPAPVGGVSVDLDARTLEASAAAPDSGRPSTPLLAAIASIAAAGVAAAPAHVLLRRRCARHAE